MMSDPSFWVLVSLCILVGLAVYYKIPALLGRMLDSRSEKIRCDLEEARRLREESAALLADFQRRQDRISMEAEDIVAQARIRAEKIAENSKLMADAVLAREEEMLTQRIELAQIAAIRKIRGEAVMIAVQAVRQWVASDAFDARRPDVQKSGLDEVASSLKKLS